MPNETHTQALKRKYEQLRGSNATYKEIYMLLQTRSELEAEEIFKRIRSGSDAETILGQVREADILLQASLSRETRHPHVSPGNEEKPTSLRHPDRPCLRSPPSKWCRRPHEADLSGLVEDVSCNSGPSQIMQRYVAIRPSDGESTSDSVSIDVEPSAAKRRRVGVSIACNACRRKKIRVC